MNDYVVIIYNGEQVSVPKEVADFLEQDRKRQQAQDKQDARHLSKSEFEMVLSGYIPSKAVLPGSVPLPGYFHSHWHRPQGAS